VNADRTYRPIPFTLEGTPAGPLLAIDLRPDCALRANSRCLIAMDPSLEITHAHDNTTPTSDIIIQSNKGSGQVYFVSKKQGTIIHVVTADDPLTVRQDALLVWTNHLKRSISPKNLPSMFDILGGGDVWLACSGQVITKEIASDLVVNAKHVLAYTGRLQARVLTLKGHENVIMYQFTGEGTIWLQTRGD